MERMKDEFISVVSHELRTPLTSIHGSLGLLAAGLANELSPKGRQLLEVAQRNSQRLVRLVGDILDLQKIEAGTMPFDLRALELGSFLVQAVEANQAYGGQFEVPFVIDEIEEGLRVRADPDRLMQVITNLLSNAARFSPPNRPVRVSARSHGDLVRVTVADSGPGIPEGFRSRVFERFAQASTSTAREKGGPASASASPRRSWSTWAAASDSTPRSGWGRPSTSTSSAHRTRSRRGRTSDVARAAPRTGGRGRPRHPGRGRRRLGLDRQARSRGVRVGDGRAREGSRLSSGPDPARRDDAGDGRSPGAGRPSRDSGDRAPPRWYS